MSQNCNDNETTANNQNLDSTQNSKRKRGRPRGALYHKTVLNYLGNEGIPCMQLPAHLFLIGYSFIFLTI